MQKVINECLDRLRTTFPTAKVALEIEACPAVGEVPGTNIYGFSLDWNLPTKELF